MGFLRETISIMSRYNRCKKDWSNHLINSRKTILEAAQKCPGGTSAVIFGAGLGYDVPLGELLDRFSEVVLVDLVHTVPMRIASLKNKRLKLLRHDVTESLDNFFRGDLSINDPHRFLNDRSADLVVSLNLLSQLPTLPLRYLEKVYSVSEDQLELIAQQLIEIHLDYLRKFSGTVCLIADLEREIVGRDYGLIGKFSALYDIKFPWVGKNWIWNIAPFGEEDPSYLVRNKVVGIPDLMAAAEVR
tara:strand:- start:113 stop:847 length:735 start_codon:yes stop_codon:yes gene_type:complete